MIVTNDDSTTRSIFAPSGRRVTPAGEPPPPRSPRGMTAARPWRPILSPREPLYLPGGKEDDAHHASYRGVDRPAGHRHRGRAQRPRPAADVRQRHRRGGRRRLAGDTRLPGGDDPGAVAGGRPPGGGGRPGAVARPA